MILYYIVFCDIILYCILLYYMILYDVILCYCVLPEVYYILSKIMPCIYYSISYYIVLCYIIHIKARSSSESLRHRAARVGIRIPWRLRLWTLQATGFRAGARVDFTVVEQFEGDYKASYPFIRPFVGVISYNYNSIYN